jgi:hypothetical protein
VFETSSVMAVAAARAIPDGVRWLSASARVGATRTGHILAEALLDHYKLTLAEMQRTGYVAYLRQQFLPYLRAAAAQFSPKRVTLTERLVDAVPFARSSRGTLPDSPIRPPLRDLPGRTGRLKRWIRGRRS